MAIAMAKLGRDLCTLGEGARSKSGRVGARCLARARPLRAARGARGGGRGSIAPLVPNQAKSWLRSSQFTASELQTVVVVVEASPPHRRLLRSEDPMPGSRANAAAVAKKASL